MNAFAERRVAIAGRSRNAASLGVCVTASQEICVDRKHCWFSGGPDTAGQCESQDE